MTVALWGRTDWTIAIMKSLSESQILSVIASLRSDAFQTEEKRKAPRVGLGTRAAILVHSSKTTIESFVRDLSVGGIGITCPVELRKGEKFSLVLTRRNEKPAHVLCEVKHCHEAVTGIFDVGAQFIKP